MGLVHVENSKDTDQLQVPATMAQFRKGFKYAVIRSLKILSCSIPSSNRDLAFECGTLA